MKKVVISISSLLLILAAASCSSLPQPMEKPEVMPQISPQVDLFKAEPSKIEIGSVVKLKWDVKDADSIIIDNGIGEVAASGSIEVKPNQVTAYNLTARNAAGSAVSAVIINVKPFVKVVATATEPASSPSSVSYSGLPKLAANESYVFFKDAVMVGANEHFIVLRNNPVAKNPTWQELKAFLTSDQTDKQPYVQGHFTCGDFAELLHNNAEAAGIRAGIVAIELECDSVTGGVINHSLNAFETTDRGIMYVDDTSSTQGYYADKIPQLELGKDYVCVSLYPQPGITQTWPSMGILKAIDIFQW